VGFVEGYTEENLTKYAGSRSVFVKKAEKREQKWRERWRSRKIKTHDREWKARPISVL